MQYPESSNQIITKVERFKCALGQGMNHVNVTFIKVSIWQMGQKKNRFFLNKPTIKIYQYKN